MKKLTKNTVNMFFIYMLGTYGEKMFVRIHALICAMNPSVFAFICLFIVFFVISLFSNKPDKKRHMYSA